MLSVKFIIDAVRYTVCQRGP